MIDDNNSVTIQIGSDGIYQNQFTFPLRDLIEVLEGYASRASGDGYDIRVDAHGNVFIKHK